MLSFLLGCLVLALMLGSEFLVNSDRVNAFFLKMRHKYYKRR